MAAASNGAAHAAAPAAGGSAGCAAGRPATQQPRAGPPLHPSTQRYASLPAAGLDARKAAVRGYKAQAARVLEHVDRLLDGELAVGARVSPCCPTAPMRCEEECAACLLSACQT